jgi:hypothetical protein
LIELETGDFALKSIESSLKGEDVSPRYREMLERDRRYPGRQLDQVLSAVQRP